MTYINVFTIDDLPQAQSLLREAFWRPGKSETFNEWTLARRVMNDAGYIPGLCLTAKEESALCGYILLSRAGIADSEGLSLGPLAVRSSCQRRGIGRALVRSALEKVRDMGFEWVAVLGGDYYRQFGFMDAADLGLVIGEDHPENPFLKILFLRDQTVSTQGAVLRYCAAFYDESGELL